LNKEERRLGAIMFTDLVGFTTLSSRDEGAALELLGRIRSVLNSIFPRFNGRVVKTMGDGFLVEFASAVEAVDCAVEVQLETADVDLVPSAYSVKLRVGIHVGDIVHSGDDVLGDAVNVASRVESLAEPGGICVTRQVVDQVEGKVRWRLTSIGRKELHNVPNPVEIFTVEAATSKDMIETPRPTQRGRVAILPFSNLSPDPNDRYFADGITEELISTVSKIGGLSVISRASAMRYRDTSLPTKQVGRELGVGAILEGSVRKAGNKVRIAAQLIEVDADRYVWSQSYDRDLTDVFGVQGEIAEQVAQGLRVQLLSKDRERLETVATESPEAYNLYLKGRFYLNERTEEGAKKAIRYFEEAIQADPKFAKAYSGMADCYLILADYGWMVPAKAGELAKMNAMKALNLDGSLAEAHASLGLALVNHQWDFAEGERELNKAIELNSNYAQAYHWRGVLLSFQRRWEAAFVEVRRAIALDPFSIVIRQSVGVLLLSQGRYQEGIDSLRKVAEENPDLPSVHYYLGIANILQSRWTDAIDEAKKEVESDNFDPSSKLDLAFAYSESGNKGEAGRILEEVLQRKDVYVSPTSIALVMLSLGRRVEGADWLRRACDERDTALLYFMSVPAYTKYAQSNEAAEVRARMGMDLPPNSLL
jgi:TolB-like protein/Flp pilus assembly protein TadD